MPSLREQLPLAIITIVLSIAIFILFKEMRAAKVQAATFARFVASFEEQQKAHQMLQLQQPMQFMMDPARAEEDQEDREDREEIVPAEPTPVPTLEEQRQPVKSVAAASTTKIQKR
jgi:hypothetical protein